MWVCVSYASVSWVRVSESASALVALTFLLVLSIYKMFSACAWKYVIKNILWHVKASIKRFSSIHMPFLLPDPLPTLFCWPCFVYCQRWHCRCGRALSFARLVTHFVFWVMFHVFSPLQMFPLRILLLCWPFGSSFYGKLHLSMC